MRGRLSVSAVFPGRLAAFDLRRVRQRSVNEPGQRGR